MHDDDDDDDEVDLETLRPLIQLALRVANAAVEETATHPLVLTAAGQAFVCTIISRLARHQAELNVVDQTQLATIDELVDAIVDQRCTAQVQSIDKADIHTKN